MNTQHRTLGRPSGAGTIAKALDVLDLVADMDRPVRFSELLARSEHPKATLYRLVQSLTHTGMLRYDAATQTYAPGLRLVRLAHAAWRQSSLAPIARPFIDALSAKLGETVHLAQMEAGQVIYVDKRNAADPIEMFSQAGKIGPGYCTGVGKAIMAHLPADARTHAIAQQSFFAHTPATLTTPAALARELDQIAARGISFDREEHERGIICIAVPIIGAGARVLGGLSVTTATNRKLLDDLATFEPDLRTCASSISEAASTWQFPSE